MSACPGAVQLLDFGRRFDGRLCIVTDLVPGTRLDQHVAKFGPLNLVQTLALGRQLLAVMSCAHAKGLLHKDINPANILLQDQQASLIDWGVSEPRGNGRAEIVLAMNDYCAPEFFNGTHDFASDFYALAWVLVFAMTGTRPYHFGTEKDRAYRVAAHALERPELPQDIPPALRRLLSSWLSKDPQQRHMGYDLDALLNHCPTPQASVWTSLDYRQLRYECSYWHQAARHGVLYAQLRYAEQLLAQPDRTTEAIYWLEQAHAKGYVTATYRLARVLEGQRGADQTLVHSLYLQAAQAGDFKAQYMLAMALLQPKNGARNLLDAQHWLRLSANASYAQSQFELAQLLKNELQQPQEADLYFAMALERGWPKPTSPVA